MKSRYLFLLLLPSSLFAADCYVQDVLQQIRPGAQWSMSGSETSSLIWISTDSVKPTTQEIQAGIADCPNQINLKQRNDAISNLLNGVSDLVKLIRAILLTLFDENNVTRGWIQAFKGQVAAATSLADLKARVAALPDMPDRTVQQAKTAVQSKINSGTAD